MNVVCWMRLKVVLAICLNNFYVHYLTIHEPSLTWFEHEYYWWKKYLNIYMLLLNELWCNEIISYLPDNFELILRLDIPYQYYNFHPINKCGVNVSVCVCVCVYVWLQACALESIMRFVTRFSLDVICNIVDICSYVYNM